MAPYDPPGSLHAQADCGIVSWFGEPTNFGLRYLLMTVDGVMGREAGDVDTMAVGGAGGDLMIGRNSSPRLGGVTGACTKTWRADGEVNERLSVPSTVRDGGVSPRRGGERSGEAEDGGVRPCSGGA